MNLHAQKTLVVTGVSQASAPASPMPFSYIATPGGDFRDHPKVADGAFEILVKIFGTKMLSGRIVLGVASLPLGMPIEIELVLVAA